MTEAQVNELMSAVLPLVRTASRISRTKLYDEELITYIRYVVDDLTSLGVDLSNPSLLSSFKNACIAYTKSAFGINNSGDKEVWKSVYENIKTRMVVRGE